MKITSIALASAFFFTAAGPTLMNTAFAAETDNPLDPSHMTDQQKAYFKDKVVKMDTKGDGMVTKEGFLKHYDELWEKNAPAGKTSVTINELSTKWASMEAQNPLDPEYKTALMRNAHVKMMDTNNDSAVTKDEFLKHMETHWVEETKRSQSPSLTYEQAMQAMTRNPLDPGYKHN
jgi:Ca2+-binding EF-hand superfamily protein